MSGKNGVIGGRAAPGWANRLIEESAKRIEKWRELASASSAPDMSREEAEKTHAIMLSVLELMELHRASLREMAQRGNGSEDLDLSR